MHLPPSVPAAEAAAFLDGLMAHLASSWSLTLNPAALGRSGAGPSQEPAAAAAPAGEAGGAKEAGVAAAAAVTGAGGLQLAAQGLEGPGAASAQQA